MIDINPTCMTKTWDWGMGGDWREYVSTIIE